MSTSLSQNSKFFEEKAAHLSRTVSEHNEPPKNFSEFSCIFSGSTTQFCICLKSQLKSLYDGLIRAWAKNEENKATLLSQTFKVSEGKVPLVLLIFSSGTEIYLFSKFEDGTLLMWSTENEKMTITQPLTKKLNNVKVLSFLQILKFNKTNKVPFVPYILPKGLRNRNFLNSTVAPC